VGFIDFYGLCMGKSDTFLCES